MHSSEVRRNAGGTLEDNHGRDRHEAGEQIGSWVVALRVRRGEDDGKKTSTRNPIEASLGLGIVNSRAAAMTLGAMPIARRGNWSTPSRIRNSVTPASSAAIGIAMTAASAKARGSSVLALNAMVTPTSATPCDANGQPPRERRMAEISAARKRTHAVSRSRPTRAVNGCIDMALRTATRLQVFDGVLRLPVLDY